MVKNYNLVPYHNFTHAFSVFAMFYYFAKCDSISQHMTDFELYFSLVACLGHDLRHSTILLIARWVEFNVREQDKVVAGNELREHLNARKNAQERGFLNIVRVRRKLAISNLNPRIKETGQENNNKLHNGN